MFLFSHLFNVFNVLKNVSITLFTFMLLTTTSTIVEGRATRYISLNLISCYTVQKFHLKRLTVGE